MGRDAASGLSGAFPSSASSNSVFGNKSRVSSMVRACVTLFPPGTSSERVPAAVAVFSGSTSLMFVNSMEFAFKGLVKGLGEGKVIEQLCQSMAGL